MPKSQPSFDTASPLSQQEAGRIKTLLQGRGIRVTYRELVGFSPDDAILLKALAGKVFDGKRLTAGKLAELAGREILQEVPSADTSTDH